jgi:deoxyribonuclease-1
MLSAPTINRAHLLILTVLLSGLCSLALSAPKSSYDEVIKNDLWGNIYKDGGHCFYSNKSFTKKSPLIVESHIYSKSWIREHLQCGTSRQCTRKSPDYITITSDLHNIVAAQSTLAFKLNTATFGALDERTEANEFGMRTRFHIVEPSDEKKGDVARAIFYMHKKYNLPLRGSLYDFVLWNELDPPSEDERKRNDLIESIQGTRNPYVDQPEKVQRDTN